MDIASRFNSRYLIDNRQIRIFLSSTFSDMQAERSALVKIFEKLKIEANRRNVSLSLIDLRWGVTEEEARSGKVISVCLNEIEHSHPFFIGLLGSHYGTSLDSRELAKNPDLKERYPWIEEDFSNGLSITEMEMQYGVLRNNSDIDAAFFIRQSSMPDDNPRLSALKSKIRDQRKYLVKDYTSIEELCEQVENEVHRILNRHYPEKEITLLDRERASQRAYINSRHSLYFRRQYLFDIIDDFIRSDEQYLVFTGESGMGKSALLANWIKENETCGDFNLVYHFLDNSFSNNSYENILRHLCDEIYNLYAIEKESIHNKKIEEEAQRLLNIIAAREKGKPLVIIIDGINQIPSVADEKLMLWLPSATKNIKFLFSTLSDDDTMRSFERRGYRIESIAPLMQKERECFIVDYLSNVGKHLNDKQLQHIISDSKCENTLVLKTLLDELICFGSYEQLDTRIGYYLVASSISDFFDRVLQRVEEDYSFNQNLVRNALTLISLSEHGLSEDELVTILGCRQLDWHLLFCAIYNHIIVKNGLVTFSHQFINTAIEKRYNVSDISIMAFSRRKIVDYFRSLQVDNQSEINRCISELAYQYYHLSDWAKLFDTLLNFNSFRYYDDTNQPLFALYWRKLISFNKNEYSLRSYLNLHSNLDEAVLGSNYNNIAIFIYYYFADMALALEFGKKASELLERTIGKEQPDTATSYSSIALFYSIQGEYLKSLEYNYKALEITKNTLGDNHPLNALSYNNIGMTYHDLGYYDKAKDCLQKALAITEKGPGTKENPDNALFFHNIGVVYEKQGDYQKALEFYYKSLNSYNLLYGENDSNVANLYNSIGGLYERQYDYPKALEYFFKALSIQEKVFGMKHPATATSYGNIGITLKHPPGDYPKALEYLFKALSIFKLVYGEEHIQVATAYNNIGLVYGDQGDYSQSLEYLYKSLKILKKTQGEYSIFIASVYDSIGITNDALGNLSKALDYHFKALKVREMVVGEKHPDTAISYHCINLVYVQKGDYTTALDYSIKAMNIRKDVFGTDSLVTADSYIDVGTCYFVMKEYEKSMEYLEKALEIRRRFLGSEHPETLEVQDYYNSAKDMMKKPRKITFWNWLKDELNL